MTQQRADRPDSLFNGNHDGGGLKSDGAREGLGRKAASGTMARAGRELYGQKSPLPDSTKGWVCHRQPHILS
jgi:hypothetical protein